MKKVAVSLVAAWVIWALTLIVADIAMAYSPPDQSSDNVTDVIIWHGDTANVTLTGSANVTLSGSANITIPGLREDMEAAAIAAVDELAVKIMGLLKLVFEGLIVLMINYFAYRFRDRWLCVAGGFALMIYGFMAWG